MNIIADLSQKALEDDYLKKIFYKAEKINAHEFFGIRHDELTEKEFIDLLRFSDLLSRSINSDAQNRAYKIISVFIKFGKWQYIDIKIMPLKIVYIYFSLYMLQLPLNFFFNY
jgi:hypothetical protein